MEVLYIPQLDEVDASGETTATRYRLYVKTPEDGVVGLADKAVNKIAITTEDALRLVMPPLVKGQVRDFFVNRKVMDIDHSVELDACGTADAPAVTAEGREGVTSPVTFKLGAKFTGLPTPVQNGYTFQGWFTEAEGGTQVTANDTVKTGITKLYAQWAVYVDPFVDAICAAKNLTFYSSGDLEWCVDSANYHSEPGAARSGPISDNQGSVLQTSFTGAGTLSFWWNKNMLYLLELKKPSGDEPMLLCILEAYTYAAGSTSCAYTSSTHPVLCLTLLRSLPTYTSIHHTLPLLYIAILFSPLVTISYTV